MKLSKKLLYSLILTGLLSLSVNAQGLTIGSGTTFSLGSSTLYLPNNWSNSGTLNAEYGTVVFNGEDGNQTMESSGEEAFSFLTVNKTSGDLQLLNNITVNGAVNIISGDIDGNDNVLILGPGLNGDITGASLHETTGNTFKGGFVYALAILNAPDAVNFMGLIISSEDDPGYTEISRGHYSQTGNDNIGILRYYNVAFANRDNLNATLIFNYDDSELNGLAEEELILFMSADEGETWTDMGGTIDTEENTVTLEGIDSFPIDGNDSHTRFTLASNSAPLPVELVNFAAISENNSVKLNWETATEVNNYGFEVERQVGSIEYGVGSNFQSEIRNSQFEVVGFLEGAGNSNSLRHYEFIDKNPTGGSKFIYRLKQIDVDGSFKYSDEIEVDVIPDNFHLSQNYPNPFNPATVINYQLPIESHILLKVYDILGNEVVTLINEEKPAGYYKIKFDAGNFSSGTYFYQIKAGSFNQVRKMLLIK